MKPHELVKALIDASGKSGPQIAREMGRAGFQGTLHKFAAGLVVSPARRTAERIARYFNLPIDAMYDDVVATRIGRELGVVTASSEPLRTEAALGRYVVERRPVHALAPDIAERLSQLKPAQMRALETIVRAYLDGTLGPVISKRTGTE